MTSAALAKFVQDSKQPKAETAENSLIMRYMEYHTCPTPSTDVFTLFGLLLDVLTAIPSFAIRRIREIVPKLFDFIEKEFDVVFRYPVRYCIVCIVIACSETIDSFPLKEINGTSVRHIVYQKLASFMKLFAALPNAKGMFESDKLQSLWFRYPCF